ncbi:MAG: hypothetical protein KatS3mg049_0581 [Caldilinea sp.]|nr:MAG: hypothetical protein KatS3mg049_0581 [Caldilinea sp.]
MMLFCSNFNQDGFNTFWYDFIAIGKERKIFGKVSAKPILTGTNL